MNSLIRFLEKENTWAKLFSKSNTPKYEINTAEGRQKVAESIDSQLSPEMLTCDGELSVSEIRVRYRYLTAAAADLRKLDPSVKFWEYSDEAY